MIYGIGLLVTIGLLSRALVWSFNAMTYDSYLDTPVRQIVTVATRNAGIEYPDIHHLLPNLPCRKQLYVVDDIGYESEAFYYAVSRFVKSPASLVILLLMEGYV
jgi:hypothetical protein